jgi:hypothetical protein
MIAGSQLSVDRFVALLGEPSASIPWRDLYAALDRAHADRDLPWLRALADRIGPLAGAHPYSHIFDIVLHAVALVRDIAAVDTLVDLVRYPRTFGQGPRVVPDAVVRDLATYLACAQEDATLASAIERHAADPFWREVLATWAQERVTRGADLRGLAPVKRLFAALAEAGHPLASFPLHLLPLEQLFPSQAGDRRVLVALRWSRPRFDPLPDPPSPGGPLPGFVRIEDTALVERAEAAFATSKAVSNGRSETGFFLLESPIAPDDVTPAHLAALPLECLAGAPSSGLRGRRATAEYALASLFWTAALGGTYNVADSGAFGRPLAWRALAALVGESEGDLARIERAARASAFWNVETEQPWFDRIMDDLCLAVLRPAGDVLAVTAWTDSD